MRMESLRGRDATVLLGRALRGLAAAAGCPITIEANRGHEWSSATFTGMRHAIVLAAAATPAFDRWLAALPEADIVLRGHIVSDLTVDQVRDEDGERRATVLALTLAEG